MLGWYFIGAVRFITVRFIAVRFSAVGFIGVCQMRGLGVLEVDIAPM